MLYFSNAVDPYWTVIEWAVIFGVTLVAGSAFFLRRIRLERGQPLKEGIGKPKISGENYRRFLVLWLIIAAISLPAMLLYYGASRGTLIFWAIFFGWSVICGSVFFLWRIWLESRRPA